jgi:pimeloyl-ACP methyl ester carboxylesterase
MSRLGALPRTLAVLALTVLIAITAACSGSSGTPTTTTTTESESIADVAPPPAERCRKPDDGTVAKAVVTASDGIELAAAEWGEGPRGIVLLHQRAANLCGWWEYAGELAEHGFHLLAIDFRGNGMSVGGAAADDLTLDAVAAVQWLKAAGAETVVLMGASMGATAAMVTVGRNPELVDGLVTLSLPPPIDVTDGNGPEPTTPQAAAPLVDIPLLMCWATRDGSAVDPQPLIDAAPTATKQVVTREGTAHGWGLLLDGAADVRPEVLTFLDQLFA